jgi:hypothetical protein
LAADGCWIVFGGDAWLVLFRNLKRAQVLQAYRDSVSACAVSSTFGVVAAGTNDGSLMIWSCQTGALVRAIELGRCVPQKILISRTWGFIISYCREIVRGALKHHLFVYTVNGSFVKRTEIAGAVDYWCCWSSPQGFDYLLCATDFGKLDISEVYEIEVQKYIYSCQGRVIAARISPELSTVILITVSGHIHILPLDLSAIF